jgi:hypothetical protein
MKRLGKAILNCALFVTFPVWGGTVLLLYVVYDDPRGAVEVASGKRNFF